MRILTVFFFALFVLTERPTSQESLPVTQSYLSQDSSRLKEAKTFRRMEVRDQKGKLTASMEVKTELSENVFTYTILKEEGSRVARSRALKGLLDGEKKKVARDNPKESSFDNDNYLFVKERDLGGTTEVTVKSKRRSEFLIDGILYLTPELKLLRSEGFLSKSPSWWLSEVLTVITYTEISNTRVPISYEFGSRVKFFGEWTVSVDYQYFSVNGESVTETK